MSAMLIRTAGPIRVSRWFGIRRLVARAARSVTVGPDLARVPSDLNGCFIPLDLTDGKRLDLSWTYETLY